MDSSLKSEKIIKNTRLRERTRRERVWGLEFGVCQEWKSEEILVFLPLTSYLIPLINAETGVHFKTSSIDPLIRFLVSYS